MTAYTFTGNDPNDPTDLGDLANPNEYVPVGLPGANDTVTLPDGYGTGIQGSITVAGFTADTILDDNDTYLAHATATITLTDGGVFTLKGADATLDEAADDTISVVGDMKVLGQTSAYVYVWAGNALNVSGNLTFHGSDSFFVFGGAVAVGGNAILGDASGDSIHMTVTDGTDNLSGATDHGTFQAANLTLDGSLQLEDNGQVTVGHTLTLTGVSSDIRFALNASGGPGSLTIGGSGGTANTLTVDSDGLLVGSGYVSGDITGYSTFGNLQSPIYSLNVVDNGVIRSTGDLVVDGNVTGTGKILINAKSTVELGGSFGNGISGVSVNFPTNGIGTLVLDNLEASNNTWGGIRNLANGDKIILHNINPGSGNIAVISATIGYLPNNNAQLYLQILAGGANYSGASVVANIPIAIPVTSYNNSDYFTVAKSSDGVDTVLTYHQGNGSPKDNPIDLAVNGQTVWQTGKGVNIGVISGNKYELQAMEEIVKDIAPDAHVFGGYGVTGSVNKLKQTCSIIVDDVTNLAEDILPANASGGGDQAIVSAFQDYGTTMVTCAGNSGNLVLPSYSHQYLWEELDVAAMNVLATPGTTIGSYLPANTEGYSLPVQRQAITGPDYGPTTYNTNPGGPVQQLYLGPSGPESTFLDPFDGTSAAAPAVAAVAALMLEANRQLTNRQIDSILSNASYATPINGGSAYTGAGLVNAALAVQAAQAAIRPIVKSGASPAAASGSATGSTVTLAYLSTARGGSVDAGSPQTLTVELSEAVTVTGVPTFTLSNGASAAYDANASDPSNGNLVFDYTPGASDYSANLAVTGLVANGATVQDSSGNNADFSLLFDAPTGVTVDSPLKVTGVASSQSGEAQAGKTVQLTLTLSKPVTVNSAGGAPTLTLSNNATATYDASLSDPATGSLVFDYTIGAAEDTSNLSVIGVNLPVGTTVQDANGDNADFSVASIDKNLGLQIGPATVSGLVALGSNAAHAGETAELALVMSTGVTISGAGSGPTLSLSDGAVASFDSAKSKLSKGLLVFDYAVGSEQTPDVEVSAVNRNGDTITDPNRVAVDFSGALNVPTGLTINSPLTVSSVQTSQTGQSAQLTLIMSEGYVADALDAGPPILVFNDGEIATFDPNASNPSADTLVFDAQLASGVQVGNLGVSAIVLNGALIQDNNRNNADFSAATTGGAVSATFREFLANQSIYDQIAGGFNVADTTVNVAAHVSALEADVANIDSLSFTDRGTATLDVTASQAKADASLLKKITGGWVLNVANVDGSTTTTGHGDKLTITDVKGDDFITGGGGSETFVFQSGFENASLVDFHNHMTGATHDTVSLPSTDFASFAAMFGDAARSGTGVSITAANGDHLVIENTTLTALQGASADFKFV
jgi:Subtilase family